MRGGNRTLIDLTGRTFGRLKVIERSADNCEYSQPRPRWLCECECGNKAVVLGANLRSGMTRSCGCLRSEKARTRAKKGVKNLGRKS